MTANSLGRPARAARASGDTDLLVATRSGRAGVCIVVVLLAVSAFAVWSSQATGIAAERAVRASTISDDYARAAMAVIEEESLARLYQLEPAHAVRERLDTTASNVFSSLAEVRRDGDAGDRRLVKRVLGRQRDYLDAIDRQFAASDRGYTATAAAIDLGEADPAIDEIQDAVASAARDQHKTALLELEHLRHLEATARRLTPVVFLAGLLLVAALASITGGHRRQLNVERARTLHDSRHDTLTGLPNRTLLAERLTHELRSDAPVGSRTGLLLIDLDRFKEINDTFGHHYGDELLTQVGTRLAAEVCDGDLVARLGGDEFAVLLTDVGSVHEASRIAGTLRTALETTFHVEGVDLDVEASVGVVLSGEHGDDATTLLQRADIAMYVAKAQNLGVFAYDPAIDEHSPAKVALLGDLRRALDHGDLVLHYQPKVDIITGGLVGAEALVRWKHPERGLVFPDEFIPLAEHTGLIGPLTAQVLAAALSQIRTWSDAGTPLTVSVNLSARNLLDEALPGLVASLLDAHGVAPGLLELEVTETAIMTEPVRALRLLDQLTRLGIRISIDDFGAGYTSLGQLKTMPVSELKIDRSFVMTMTEDPSNALIVRSIVDLGHNLGLTLVAEGVETAGALDALAAFGCDVAQGYLFSRPLPVAAFDAWRADRRPPATAGRLPVQRAAVTSITKNRTR
ncbi:putative bifunctional diguanylate cyclase/phosphodiesterase [Pengzhenrongella sp.]|jgi:diguanylate cyclase (GGDEF)-like protein|uniref:putative bifunctional diguanylate cyclase/phosphodiesterase n=1 Tax=Pengzhenrongella sp. TaxID=2888820 RepID=UPI002F9576A6